MSFSCLISDELIPKINALQELNVRIVVSVGNVCPDANDGKFPRCLDNVIVVASSTMYDTIAYYSNYRYSVTLFAPASQIKVVQDSYTVGLMNENLLQHAM